MKKILYVLISAVFLCSCSLKEEKSAQRDIFAMDTFMTVKAYGEKSENAVNLSAEKIRQLEKLFSVTDSESDISKINNAHGKPVKISDDTADIMNFALDMCRKTDGNLDITIYPVLKEWGFTGSEYKIPDSRKISELLELVDYKKINIDGNIITIPENMQTDLGSAAKGYAADRIAEIFRENSIESGIINLGGNIAAVGSKPDGSDWNIGIADPYAPEKNICTVDISDCAVVTSGNYERYFTDENGNRYWHILNPENGYPADSGLVSVTVIGKSAAVCDALSTALFVMGTEKASEYYQNNTDFEAVMIDDNSDIFITQGIADCIHINDDSEFSIINREQ